MKKLITAAALAALAATPVIAQTAEQSTLGPRASASQLNTRNLRQQHSPNAAYDVYSTTGRYVGSDPDPQVRTMLQLDQFQNGE
jgi:hypothetical protein